MFPSRLYAIVDDALARQHGWAPADLAQAYLRAGVRMLQVRAKRASSAALLELADACVAAARPSGALVIVNDRADVARLAGAAGVHLGQEDLPARAARQLLGEAAIIGLSTHTIDRVAAAAREPVSYLAAGPVFVTDTKPTGRSPIGPAGVREAVRRAGGRPVVGIGGITLSRAPEVLAAGAAAVAVIGDLLATGDPEARAREFLALLDREF